MCNTQHNKNCVEYTEIKLHKNCVRKHTTQNTEKLHKNKTV